MGTRPVRSESGAVFDVDASMVDDVVSGGYRTSSAPPPTTAIRPAPVSTIWPQERVLAMTMFVLVTGVAVLAMLR